MKSKKIIQKSKAKLKGFGKLPKVKLSESNSESIVSKNARMLENLSYDTWTKRYYSTKIKVKPVSFEIKKWPNAFSAKELAEMLNPSNILLIDMEETFKACLETAKKKNADYAGEDQVDPFKNFKNCVFLGVSVEKGILVRMMDKMSRVSNLLTQEAQVKDEAIEDTLADLVNYAAILKSYIKRKNTNENK